MSLSRCVRVSDRRGQLWSTHTHDVREREDDDELIAQPVTWTSAPRESLSAFPSFPLHLPSLASCAARSSGSLCDGLSLHQLLQQRRVTLTSASLPPSALVPLLRLGVRQQACIHYLLCIGPNVMGAGATQGVT